MDSSGTSALHPRVLLSPALVALLLAPSYGCGDSAGPQKVLLVDFDVAESFGQEGSGSGQWVMHPVINATDFQVASAGGGGGV
jgi:hypothetical protein